MVLDYTNWSLPKAFIRESLPRSCLEISFKLGRAPVVLKQTYVTTFQGRYLDCRAKGGGPEGAIEPSTSYITLIGDGNALEKIDTFHDCPPCLLCRSSPFGCEGQAPRLRATPFALERVGIGGKKSGLPPEALPDCRAKGGGADRDRTDDLLNAIKFWASLPLEIANKAQ